MADNIVLNAGSGGDTLAADDDGTAKHQQVKVEYGVDGTQTPASLTNPLPVAPMVARSIITRGLIALTASTETTLLAAGGATVFLDLTKLSIINSGASGVLVTIRDVALGSAVERAFIAAGGGGVVFTYGPAPLPQASVNTAWTAQTSIAVSTVYVQAVAVKR